MRRYTGQTQCKTVSTPVICLKAGSPLDSRANYERLRNNGDRGSVQKLQVNARFSSDPVLTAGSHLTTYGLPRMLSSGCTFESESLAISRSKPWEAAQGTILFLNYHREHVTTVWTGCSAIATATNFLTLSNRGMAGRNVPRADEACFKWIPAIRVARSRPVRCTCALCERSIQLRPPPGLTI
jgi:hypothetical protein